MFPEDTESTPLLNASNAIAISHHDHADSDNDTISSTDHREQQLQAHTRLTSSYRRPSFVTGGGRGLLLAPNAIPEFALRDDEAFDCICEEHGLLQQNCILTVPSEGGSSRRGSIAANVVAEVEESWEEAVKSGKIKTSWKHELGVLTRYSVFTCVIFGVNVLRRLWW
jgi:hypothetical protein